MSSNASAGRLERVVGLPGAVFMGLGSILGTGIFVSIGIAAGVIGPSVVVATWLAGLAGLALIALGILWHLLARRAGTRA